jgi:PA14 domain
MGVRTNIASADDDFLIYDVVNDTHEANNLAPSMPELEAELKTLAVSGRRPEGDAPRPYDAVAVPATRPPAGLANGVRWKRYAGPFPWVPELRALPSTAIGSDATFAPAKHAPDDGSGLFYTGFIQVPVAGDYTFFITSDAGASLHVHDAHVIDDDFNHDGSEVSGTITLEAGYHPYRLCYRHVDGAQRLDVQWSGPDLSKQAIPASNLFFDPQADLGSGGAGGAGGLGGASGSGGGSDVGGAGGTGAGGGGGTSGGAGGATSGGAGGRGGGAPPSQSGGCACSLSSAEQWSPARAVWGGLALVGLSIFRRAARARGVEP